MTRIALVGSSSVSERSALVRALASAWGMDTVALGVVGRNPRTWVREHRTQTIRDELARADGIVVYVPGNGVTTDDDVRAVHAELMAFDLPIWWVLPPTYESAHEAEATLIAAVVARAGVPLLSPTRAVLKATDLARDGVHVTAAGAARLAAQLPAPSSRPAGAQSVASSGRLMLALAGVLFVVWLAKG